MHTSESSSHRCEESAGSCDPRNQKPQSRSLRIPKRYESPRNRPSPLTRVHSETSPTRHADRSAAAKSLQPLAGLRPRDAGCWYPAFPGLGVAELPSSPSSDCYAGTCLCATKVSTKSEQQQSRIVVVRDSQLTLFQGLPILTEPTLCGQLSHRTVALRSVKIIGKLQPRDRLRRPDRRAGHTKESRLLSPNSPHNLYRAKACSSTATGLINDTG